jgi:hypothetical protein
MKTPNQYSRIWAGGIWAGAMALAFGALALTLSGCRVGNYVVEPPGADTISGYYETAPQRLQVCAQLGTTTQASACVDANPSQVPAFLSVVVSNPVALIMSDLTHGYAFLVNPATRQQLPLDVSTTDNQTLSFNGNTGTQTLWMDPACSRQLYVQEQGSINLTDPTRNSGSSLKITGRLDLVVDMAYSFDGSCAASLVAMQSCYTDRTQCGGSSDADNQNLQAAVNGVFGDFIQAGAMSATDIGQVVGLGYTVTYQ